MTAKTIDNRMRDFQRFNGWTFDRLLREMATTMSLPFGACECSGDKRACVHAAAACLAGLIRIIEHPDNCPDCAAIEARREAASEGGGNESMH